MLKKDTDNSVNSGGNRFSGETPFSPEYDEFIKKYPGRGLLKVQASVARQSFPVEDVEVDVATIFNGKRYSIYNDVTDSSGIVNGLVLPALPREDSLNPNTAGDENAEYLVSLYHPSYVEVIDRKVKVYDRIETILPVALIPLAPGSEGI